MPGQYPFSMEFTIVCEGGTLNYHSDIRPLTLFRTREEPEVLVSEGGDGYQAELQAFADACGRGETPPLCPPEESKAAVELTLAALKSRQQAGRAVRV